MKWYLISASAAVASLTAACGNKPPEQEDESPAQGEENLDRETILNGGEIIETPQPRSTITIDPPRAESTSMAGVESPEPEATATISTDSPQPKATATINVGDQQADVLKDPVTGEQPAPSGRRP